MSAGPRSPRRAVESGVTRRPRLASQAATGRWAELVQVGTINGELVAAQTRMPLDSLSVWRPSAAAKSRCIRRLPLAARDERLAMVAAYDPRNVVLRGDTSLLMDIAHMADWPVRATVREWAALLARSRDGGLQAPPAERLPACLGCGGGSAKHAPA